MIYHNTGIQHTVSYSGSFTICLCEQVINIFGSYYPMSHYVAGDAGLGGIGNVSFQRYGGNLHNQPNYTGQGYLLDGSFISSYSNFRAGYTFAVSLPCCSASQSITLGYETDIENSTGLILGTVTWELSCETELWIGIEKHSTAFTVDDPIVDNHKNPAYEYTDRQDGLSCNFIQTEYRTKVGGNASISGSCNFSPTGHPAQQSFSVSGVIDSEIVIPYGPTGTSELNFGSGASTSVNEITLNINHTISGLDGASLSFADNKTILGVTGSVVTNLSPTSVTSRFNNFPSGFYADDRDWQGILRVEGSKVFDYTTLYDIKGINDSLEILSPYEIKTLEGKNKFYYQNSGLSLSNSYESETISHSISTGPQTIPYFAYLTKASLEANKDDIRDWRLQFEGKKYKCGSIKLNSRTNLTTLLVSGVTSNTIVLPDTLNTEAYRFIELKNNSNDSRTLDISFVSAQGQTWDYAGVTLSPLGTTLIDLCSPDNLPDPADSTQFHKYPLTAPRIPGTNVNTNIDSLTWGLDRLDEIVFTNLDSGVGYNITLDFVIKHKSKLTPAILNFNNLIDAWESPTDVTKAGITTYLNTDGRHFVDSMFYRIDPLDEFDPKVYRYYSIDEFFTLMDEMTGIVVQRETTFSDDFHDLTQPALFLTGVDLDITNSTADIYAIPLFDQILIYPGSWDKLTNSDLKVTKYLKGHIWGLAYYSSIVNLTKSGENRGTSTVGNNNQYETKKPFGIPLELHNINNILPQAEITSRIRHRTVLIEPRREGKVLDSWFRNDGQLQWIYINDNDEVILMPTNQVLHTDCAWCDLEINSGSVIVDVLTTENVFKRLFVLTGGEKILALPNMKDFRNVSDCFDKILIVYRDDNDKIFCSYDGGPSIDTQIVTSDTRYDVSYNSGRYALIIYASGNFQIYMSSDRGNTWILQ